MFEKVEISRTDIYCLLMADVKESNPIQLAKIDDGSFVINSCATFSFTAALTLIG